MEGWATMVRGGGGRPKVLDNGKYTIFLLIEGCAIARTKSTLLAFSIGKRCEVHVIYI